MTLRQRTLPALGLGLAAAVSASPGAAQHVARPGKPITIAGGLPDGSGTDTSSRRLAEPLSRALRTPAAGDTRVGAGGSIAMDPVAGAEPDFHAIPFATSA